MQYGRCVQMSRESTLHGGSGSLFKIQVFCTIAHYTSAASVRTLQLSGPMSLTMTGTLSSTKNTLSYLPRHTVSLYIYSECHMWVGSFRSVAICMAICTCIKFKLQSVKFQTFSQWWCWWFKSSGIRHDVVPQVDPKRPPTVQQLLTHRHHIS